MSATDATVPEASLTSRKPLEPAERPYRRFGTVPMGAHRMRYSTMKLEYLSKWWQRHRDIARHINPRRGFFDGYIPNYNLQIDHKLVMDGTPQRAIRTLAAGMQSGLSNQSTIWYLLGLPDRDLEKFAPVKEWLEIVRDVMMRVQSESNTYETLHQSYEEEALFGTSAFQVDEDFDTVINLRSFTAGEYYLGRNPQGRYNAFARFHWMTVDNIVNEFGFDNCSERIKDAYRSGQRDTYFQVFQLCEENTTKDDGKMGWEGMKFKRVTWEADVQADKALRVGGYNEFPVVATVWDVTTTADIYGTGPGFHCIGDVKSSYKMKKTIWLGEEKKVDPPVVINSSVQGTPQMTPGGITYSSSQNPNQGATAAYQVNPDTKGATELWMYTKQDINEWFYVDLFKAMISAPDDTQKTAAEIAKRYEAQLMQLGPVLERQFGKFKQLINRTFMICLRAGILPPPPPEIAGMPLVPRFVSSLAQAMQAIKGQSIERTLAFVGNAVAVYPEMRDVFDPDEMGREYATASGAPAKIIRSPEQVQQIREQKQQQEQQIRAQQQAMAAVSAAKTLSETNVGDRSALEHMTGAQPAPQGGTA